MTAGPVRKKKSGGLSGLLRRWFGVFSDPEDFELDEAPNPDQLLAVFTRLRLSAGAPSGLPAPFAPPLRALCRSLGVFSGRPAGELPAGLPGLLEELAKLADSLLELEASHQKQPSYEWNKGTGLLFGRVAELASRLNALASAELPGSAALPGADQDEILRRRALLPATMKLRESIARFETAQAALPEAAQASLGAIVLEASAIIETMEADPEAIKSGSRFLTRYLAAAGNILEQFEQLRGLTPDARERIAQKTGDLLARLAEAFRAERETLSAQGVRLLSADLSVLDKLLKMEGH